MPLELIIILIFMAVGFLVLGLFVYSKLNQFSSRPQDDQLTKDIVNQVFGELADKITKQTKAVLESDKEAIYKDTENKRLAIEKLVRDLKSEIDERQDEIRKLEKDRNLKFGEISKTIKQHQDITKELQSSTQALAKVLSNNQARGLWGENIIEDILTQAGLIESTHYLKQSPLGTYRPDITLLLPESRKVAVDVKFPYSEIQQMAATDNKKAKQQHQAQFERDVKQKIADIHLKYINPDEGTLDYAIMFVPNEMVFSYINQKFPHLVTDAMTKHVMLVSPFTFLIVARTVFEAYRSFTMAHNLRTITDQINEFTKEWHRFTDEFDKLDRTIARLRSDYDQIQTTRYRQMERRLESIEDYRRGNLLETGEPN